MRTVSLTFRRAMLEQQSGETAAVLLTITHPSLAQPIYLSSDPTTRINETPVQYATVSRGNTYQFLPFSITLPDDVSERSPVARIQLDNVDRRLVTLIRSITSPPSVNIEVVLISTPNVVEMSWPNFQMKSAPYNAGSMTIELSIDALTDEPFPGDSFDSSGFPALF